MKTYKNSELGFEIALPKQWPYPIKVSSDSIVFFNSKNETMNMVVGPLAPERLPDYTKFEFQQYAHRKKYEKLEFGEIRVGETDHIWAKYRIKPGEFAKKYMIVFGGIEYAITALCTNEAIISQRESGWDEIVKSFRLSKWREQDKESLNIRRKNVAGEIYQEAYEAASKGKYSEACSLLRKCLDENPNHILAHKEIAFILKNTGDVKGALVHRQKVKQLDPSDRVNCFNLAGIYVMLGQKGKALQEIDELLGKEPNNSLFLEFRKKIKDFKP